MLPTLRDTFCHNAPINLKDPNPAVVVRFDVCMLRLVYQYIHAFGVEFRIHVHDKHLGFNVVEPHKLRLPTGIVGSLLQEGAYTIIDNNVYVESTENTAQRIRYRLPSELVHKNKCYKIPSANLNTLYQQQTRAFLVKSIFSLSERLNPKLLASSTPK